MAGDVALLSPTATGGLAWWASLVPLIDGAGRVAGVLGICRCGASRSEDHLSLTLQTLHGAEWRYDLASGQYAASGEVAMLLGEPVPRAVTWPEWLQRVHPDDRAIFSETPAATGTREFRFQAFDGSQRWARCAQVAIWGEGGEVEAVLGIMIDITEERRREAALVDLAAHDPLTGLLNRRGFHQAWERLRAELPAASQLALLVLDLDQFKATNDSHGHAAGDAVLIEAAHRMTMVLGPAVCARVGGDEFAVALPVGSDAEAHQLRARLLQAMRRPLAHRGRWLPLLASVGLACGASTADLACFIEIADTDLYARKHARGGAPSIAA